MSMIGIEEVIELLREEYARSKELDYVRDPIAFSLYRVWKKVDEKNRRKKLSAKGAGERSK